MFKGFPERTEPEQSTTNQDNVPRTTQRRTPSGASSYTHARRANTVEPQPASRPATKADMNLDAELSTIGERLNSCNNILVGSSRPTIVERKKRGTRSMIVPPLISNHDF